MIVHPDFLDHWKTRQLIEMTQDSSSPLIIFRLWAYCQKRKTSVFPGMTPIALAHACHSSMPADRLYHILAECRFIRQEADRLIVHDWDQVNRMLISAWDNGKKGGNPANFNSNRPATRPATHRQPTGTAHSNSNSSVRTDKELGPAADRLSEQPRLTEEQRLENIKKFGAQVGSIAAKLKAGEL